MSNLSWLNPTPHAIAVYASQPLSPVATQHSLPSGRYPLLGPDLHRLDRTSFAWRTYSITSSTVASSVGGTVKFQPFCRQLGREKIDPGQVAARPGETGNETKLDRVFPGNEDDGNTP